MWNDFKRVETRKCATWNFRNKIKSEYSTTRKNYGRNSQFKERLPRYKRIRSSKKVEKATKSYKENLENGLEEKGEIMEEKNNVEEEQNGITSEKISMIEKQVQYPVTNINKALETIKKTIWKKSSTMYTCRKHRTG